MKTPEEVGEITSLRAPVANISESMQNIKTSKSKDDKAAYSAFKSLAFGKNVSKSKARKSLSKLVNVGCRSVSTGILSGEKKSWLDLERKLEVMLSARNTSSSFSTFGHMKQAGQQGTKKMLSGKEQEKNSTSNTRSMCWKNANRGICGVPGTIPGNKD